ncbi:MAG: universal stress protein [Bacteroidia bacterium]|nr:universal stress protein [Bacteroidia bacterium]
MVNILVPTDFSDLSKVAIKFATKVANQLDGNITLLHVISITQPTRASLRLKLESLERELIKYAKEDFEELIAEVSKDLKTTQPLRHKTVVGANFNDAVKKEAKRLRSGLIVMGTAVQAGSKSS